MENLPQSTALGRANFLRVLEPLAAVILLAAVSFILYRPHIFQLRGVKLLLPVYSIVASMGCFALGRRWLGTFDASFWSGLLYGFGPFGLSFAAYHPLAGLCYAAIPWLFCPAVFYHSRAAASLRKTVLTAVLTVLPFAIIMLAFWTAAHFTAWPLFPMPKNRLLGLDDFKGLLTPMAYNPHTFVAGFYHVPLTLAAMGTFVYVVSRRFWVLPAVLAGLLLSISAPVFEVSPILWAGVPALFVCVLCGLGIQALAWAGPADRKWVLFCAAAGFLLAALNGAIYLSGQKADVYLLTTFRFLLAGGLGLLIFLMTALGLRLSIIRWICIWSAIVFDVLYSAPALVDRLF